MAKPPSTFTIEISEESQKAMERFVNDLEKISEKLERILDRLKSDLNAQ